MAVVDVAAEGPRRRVSPAATAVPASVALTLLVLGAAAVTTLAVLDAPRPIQVDLPLVAHTAGLLAGYAVTVLLLLMSRTPALERGVGADRMARWHGRVGRATLVLIVVHGVAATLGWAAAQGMSVIAATEGVLDMPGLLAATVATGLFVAIGMLSARAARRRLRYETWHAIHLLTYLAIALSFSHELAGPDLAGRPAVQISWSVLYTVSIGLVVRYRLIAPVLQAVRHRLRVQWVFPEGPDTVSVVVRGRHLDELQAEPGQFFRWRFLTRSTWRSAHPFSLSAPPSNEHLRLTVKAVGDGTRLVQQLRPGTVVLAGGPYGAMTERRRTRHGVLLIAGGVGITPMRTLFETLREGEVAVTLLYRASTPADLLFREELEWIAASRRARLIMMVGPSSNPRNAMSAENLTRLVPDLRFRDVYICAAPGLAAAARTGLLAAGLPKRHLHQEEFSF